MTETPHDARERLVAVRQEVAKAVVGQDAAVSGLLVALLCGGHVLMEGVPGTAKTLLVRTLSASLSVSTRRVQFTPDLLPSDILGTSVYDAGRQQLLSATDRSLPVLYWRTRSTGLPRRPSRPCSRRWRSVSQHRRTDAFLPRGFTVCATQNPVEYEGTYPLPEAQLDRFLLKVVLPSRPARRAGDPHPVRGRLRPARRRRRRRPRWLGHDMRPARPRNQDRAGLPRGRGYIVDVVRATRDRPRWRWGQPAGATALLRSARAWGWLRVATS